MRIGIDIGKALGPLDGIGRYGRGLLQGLMAVDRENRYSLYPLFEAASAERFREVFPDPPANFTLAGGRRPAPEEVDLFHATTGSVPQGWQGPLVFTLFDLTILSHPQAHTLDNRLHWLLGLARALARGARLAAISRCTRHDAWRLLGVAEEGIEVVYPAAGEEFRPRGDEEVRRLRERYALALPYVLSVGTREPRKNLAALVEAFRGLPPALRDEHSLVVAGGEGWLGPEPGEPMGEEGEAEVRFLGRVPDQDLPALYSGARLFAYPSLYEGFGLPPLEAMRCGAPVLTSRVAALPEVVGEAALLVEAGSAEALRDGLAALLADPERRRELRDRGLAQAQRFTWEETARRTLALYRAAAGG